MGRAKEIEIRVIPSSIANPFIRAHHYSGKVVNNSKLHFGAFLDGRLHGVLSYGPSLDKKKIMGLVEGTTWDGFLELNRMAFDDYLPGIARATASPKRSGLSGRTPRRSSGSSALRTGAAAATAPSTGRRTSSSRTLSRRRPSASFRPERKSTR